MTDLKTFLKVHSVIPNTFIDSFLSMYNPETLQTDLIINIDKVCKWLNITKFNILRTLRSSYREDIDYTIVKSANKKGKYGGNNYKLVMISPDCFKRLCMRSTSKKAEEVRTYFIELESLLVRYRTTLMKGMDNEIQLMERALKPKNPEDSAGYIYVLKASPERDSVFKIGRTKDLNKRLSTYSTGTLHGVELVFKFRTDNYRATEECVKAMVRPDRYKKYNEIYKAEIDMIKELIKKCDETAQYRKLYTAKKAPIMKGGYYFVLEKIDQRINT